MSPRPLALVLGLTAGDYLLWNWSLSGNRAIPALVSGLTLPPLAAASMLLLAATALRLLARSTRRWGAGQAHRVNEPAITVRRASRPDSPRSATPRAPSESERVVPVADDEAARRPAAAGDQRSPARKLAA